MVECAATQGVPPAAYRSHGANSASGGVHDEAARNFESDEEHDYLKRRANFWKCPRSCRKSRGFSLYTQSLTELHPPDLTSGDSGVQEVGLVIFC